MDIALDKRREEKTSRRLDNSRQTPRPDKVRAASRYIPSHIRARVHGIGAEKVFGAAFVQQKFDAHGGALRGTAPLGSS